MTRPVFLLEFHDLLVDTRAARFAALREALQHEGIAIDDDVYDARFAGLSIADAVRAAAQGTALELDETGLDLATMRATAAQADRDPTARTPAGEGAPEADRPLEAVILKTAERPTAADRSAAPVPATPPSRGKPAQRLW